MDALLKKQATLAATIAVKIRNFKKSPMARRTSKGYLEGQLAAIEILWKQFYNQHNEVMELKTDAHNEKPYFVEEVYETIDDETSEIIGTIKDSLYELDADNSDELLEASRNITNAPTPRYALPEAVRLPRIEIPKFSGDYQEWRSFHDLYVSIIHDNISIPDVQKLHYLKSNLQGEAQALIRGLQVTAANYQSAWNLLYNRYENKRHLVHTQLRRLFQQSAVTSESSQGIRSLLDTTNECIQTLKNLEIVVDTWDPILVYITTRNLPSVTQQLWEQSLESIDMPTYAQLAKFLENRFHALDMLNETSIKTKEIRQKKTNSYHSSNVASCKLCAKATHPLRTCSSFINMNVSARHDYVRNKNLCKNCFAYSHNTATCPVTRTCSKCSKKHHTLLHFDQTSRAFINSTNNKAIQSPASTSSSSTPPSASSPSSSPASTSSSFLSPIQDPAENQRKNAQLQQTSSHVSVDQQYGDQKIVVLPTALIQLKSSNGRFHTVRALLDQGSQSTFITEATVQLLGLHKTPIQMIISGIGKSEASTAQHKVNVQMHSHQPNQPSVLLNAIVLKTLTSFMPSQQIFLPKHILGDICLADPMFGKPGKVDILLGADVYSKVILPGIKTITNGPLLQNTTLGWIISGDIAGSNQNHRTCLFTETKIDDALKLFWELEETQPKRILSSNDKLCEQIYHTTHRRLENGSYEVTLPFVNNADKTPYLFGKSRDIAVSRLLQMERRFRIDAELKTMYTECLNGYIAAGHMVEVNTPETTFASSNESEPKYSCSYLPHHAVHKQSSATTKLRVVFDASCKTSNGVSLNDTLLTGPVLQDELIHIIMKWRRYPIVINADIEKMYRQIHVVEPHTQYQRIVWRPESNQPIKDFRLTTVTFGTASAPYLAIKTIQQLAKDEESTYPLGSKSLTQDFYVDDLLAGSDNVTDAIQLQQQISSILQTGGFPIRQWSSNSFTVLQQIDPAHREVNLPLNINLNNTIKKLGLHWNPASDQLSFKIAHIQNSAPTKRNILSEISKLFDPLGWLAPTIIIPKMLMQKIWLAGVSWDETLPENIVTEWKQFQTSLNHVETLQIPRWINTYSNSTNIELHGFSDASEKAYAAVIYLKITNPDDPQVQLIIAKTRVSPIKQVSIPRLELCAAVLLANLMEKVIPLHPNASIHAWTDSNIVIAWLHAHPNKWKSFVANRVSRIHEILPSTVWHHIRTHDNPADCASRGTLATDLIYHPLWWTGPSWLKQTSKHWPVNNKSEIIQTDAELKKSTVVLHSSNDEFLENLSNRYSSFIKLVRVTAYCYKFISKIQSTNRSADTTWLTAAELQRAVLFWIKWTQKTSFSQEINALNKNQSIHAKSRILNLNPFIDEDDLLRVGGRLKKAEIPLNHKYPIIMPNNHQITSLVIDETHFKTHHGGVQLMMACLRERYWILNCRNTIRHRIHKCMVCYRYRAKGSHQLMGNLPEARVNESRCFTHTGVDYCGPFEVLEKRGRGKRQITKGYISVFVCLSTKAIHLELVTDMTTQAFIAALHRFTSRRGLPTNMYSDHGTNFVGANNVFKKQQKLVEEEVAEIMAVDKITWSFIPVSSPHFGGLWEAGVKSTKFHLKRILGNTRLTYEEFSTTLCQIEACLNSRPLCPMTSDPDDLTTLTPGHFLIGTALLSPPEPSLLNLNVNRLDKWQLVNRLSQHFWDRWRIEYLNRLQSRPKWLTKQPSLQVNDMVLIKDERLPPMKWQIGRIIKVGGEDNLTRTVTVRTQHNQVQKPITKLCLLPIN